MSHRSKKRLSWLNITITWPVLPPPVPFLHPMIAEKIGIKSKQVYRIGFCLPTVLAVSGRGGAKMEPRCGPFAITIESTSDGSWVGLQTDYDTALAKDAISEVSRASIALSPFMFSRVTYSIPALLSQHDFKNTECGLSVEIRL